MEIRVVTSFSIDVDEPQTDDELIYEAIVHAQIDKHLNNVTKFALSYIAENETESRIKQGGSYMIVGPTYIHN